MLLRYVQALLYGPIVALFTIPNLRVGWHDAHLREAGSIENLEF